MFVGLRLVELVYKLEEKEISQTCVTRQGEFDQQLKRDAIAYGAYRHPRRRKRLAQRAVVA